MEPLSVAFLAQVHQLQHVLSSSQYHGKRLVILLLAPCELTRLVEKTSKRVQTLLFRKHTSINSS